jgi:hypothetical protein
MSGTYSNPPCTEEGTKNFHNTSKSCGIFRELNFHETKIPTVDRKVQVWTKFWKFFFWKKVKSPLSMNFGRISTSKCRGMLQKMGCCTINPPKKPRPLLHARALKKSQKKE